ncbi:hypothetical protein PG993_008890 [Apiospora rasikravindrae]|uniref:Uncharacterized protein n=1 Tax=Apiospora rasikravindrae TaxID=990691 RepID=A0ABR1SR10_9PEZI
MPDETRFTHPVVVVCEQPSNRVAKDTTLHVETTCSPSTSVLFTFSADTADRARAPSLQITADRISSLARTVHDHTTRLVDSPPCIDLVRQQLGTTRNLTRLHFRLRALGCLTSHVGEVAPELQNSEAADALISLAGTSIFSVYMAHDALPKATYNVFYRAVRPFLNPTEFLDSAAAPHQPEPFHPSSPPKYVNETEGRTPSHESDNDTVAVTTPSGYGPPDDEELPGYPDSESDHFTSDRKLPGNNRKRYFRRSSGGSSNRATSKRRLWSPDAEAFVETESPSPSVHHSDSRLDAIEARMRQQDERIEKLEAENRQFKTRNADLERRVAELEGCVRDLQGLESRVDQLGEQHEVLEETVANVDVHQSELEADCSRIGPADDVNILKAAIQVSGSMESDPNIGLSVSFNPTFIAVGLLYADAPVEAPAASKPFLDLQSLMNVSVPLDGLEDQVAR